MFEALTMPFIQNALIASLLIAIGVGVIGTLVVVNRMVFLAGGVAHTAYGGIGLAFFCGFSPLLGAGIFGVVAAFFMAYMFLKEPHRCDTIIGVTWAIGMAIGVILIDLSPAYNTDLMSYLFGSMIAIERSELLIFALLDAIVCVWTAVFYRKITAISFDNAFARTKGINTEALFVAMFVFVSLIIIMAIRMVGLMLVIALLTIPVWLAERVAATLAQTMILSMLLALAFMIAGLILSYWLNLTSGAAIIVIASAVFFICEFFRFALKRQKR
jgi:zinc transport system permease protein